jgi:hypothetical protein
MGEAHLANNTEGAQVYLWVVTHETFEHEALGHLTIAQSRMSKFLHVPGDALCKIAIFTVSAVFVHHR